MTERLAPAVLVVTGVSGAGKTTLVRALDLAVIDTTRATVDESVAALAALVSALLGTAA